MNLAPSRYAVEPTSAFSLNGGSWNDITTRYVPVRDNDRLAGLGCEGDRTCAPCAAKMRAGTSRSIMGLASLGEVTPAFRDSARAVLLSYAQNLSTGADDVSSGDLDGSAAALAQLSGTSDMSELNDPSLQEVAASKVEAQGSLQALVQALSSIQYPAGANPPSQNQLAIMVAEAKDVALRLHSRALSSDFDAPAVLSAADQAQADALERLIAAGISRETALAMLQHCSPQAMLTQEITPADWVKQCTPLPEAFDFKKILLFGAGLLALSYFAGRAT